MLKKTASIIIIIGFLIPAPLSKGCIFYDFGFQGYSFIGNHINDNTRPMAPYFLDIEKIYSDYFEKEQNTRNLNNLEEWQERFCKLVTLKDLEYIIYKAPVEDLEILRTVTNSKNLQLDFRLAANSFARHLKKHKCLETIDYLIYAKACEPHVLPTDPWNNSQRDTLTMHALIKRGRKLFRKSTSHYIRLRLAYQMIRLAHYAKDYQMVLDLWEDLLPKIEAHESILDYWIMGHKAGALKSLGRKVEAAYLFSLVFYNCPSKRASAFNSFQIDTDEEWRQILLLCKNDKERAMLYTLRAQDKNSRITEELKHIYHLDPQNDFLDLLLIREVKKLERDFLGLEFNDKKQHNKQYFNLPRSDAGNRIINLRTFVGEVIAESKIKHPDLWKITEGYLEFLSGDYYAAGKTFQRIRPKIQKKELREQLNAFELALQISAYRQLENEEENEIAEIIRSHSSYKEYKDFPDFLHDKLEHIYLNTGHPGKAFRCHYSLSTLAYNPRLDIINNLLSICENPDANRLEKTFVEDKKGNSLKNQLLEMKGTLLMGRFQFEAALEILKRIPHSERQTFSFDLFKASIKDCVHCPPSDTTVYDRATLIEKLIDLDYKAKSELDKSAAYYYMLGLAYYNMTYFGNAYRAMDYFRSGGSWGQMKKNKAIPYLNTPFGNIETVDCSKALYYFEKAFLLAKTPELAARAAFMAAKCEQNEYFLSDDYKHNPYSNKIPDVPDEYRQYFQILKTDFQDTEYYQQIIRECLYFEAYAKKN